MQSFEKMKLGNETSFHFKGDVGECYNRALLGMIFQWRKSCLEVMDAILENGHGKRDYDIERQKNWIYNFVPKLMIALNNFHNLVPIGVLKKSLLSTYLGRDTFEEKDELDFLYNMAACTNVQVITCYSDENDITVIATRFDDNDGRLFAFGY